MVAPHPDLQRRISNTDNIVQANKSEFVPNLSTKYPWDYIDLNTHSVLIDIKPWVEDVPPISSMFPNSMYPNSNSMYPNIQTCWGPFFATIDKILVLCVDFSDLIAQTTIPTINNRFFSKIGDSFLTYYKEISYSKFIPSGEVHGWYRAPHPYSYYINNDNGYGAYPNNAKRLVEDTIDMALVDPAIDWASFDTNNNGKIDNIMIVHAGAEAAWSGSTNLFWAHTLTITATKYVLGKSIDRYTLTSEYIYAGASQRIGIDCHEFGHLLDLPDLYNSSGKSRAGKYSLMDVGCWGNNGLKPAHLDAWSKYKVGFMDITTNPQGIGVIVNDVETNADAMKYTTTDPKEYFLIENRQKISFDTYIPGSGILIWHINENKANNNDNACLLVELLQADGLRDLENNVNNGDADDPYPGTGNKRSFGVSTTPNSLLCNSTTKDMSITNISNSGTTMTYDATLPPIVDTTPPGCRSVTIVSPPHIEATTITIDKSVDPCKAGSCTVTVNVTWRNTGGVAGLFTPTITIDGTPVTLTDITLNPFETVGDSVIKTFTLTNLTFGTHTICPVPN